MAMVMVLNAEQVARLREAFQQCDEDGDGQIPIQELAKGGSSTGAENLKEIYDKFDSNDNGALEFPEYVKLIMVIALLDKQQGKPSKDKIVALNAETINGLQKIFNSYDRDGNGSITIKQLEKVMRLFGDGSTRAELKLVDSDGNGTIQFAEFLNFMADKFEDTPANIIPVVLNTEQINDLQRVFQKFDKDGDGIITSKEMAKVMGKNFSPELMELFDTDGNGTIDFAEFLNFNGTYGDEYQNPDGYVSMVSSREAKDLKWERRTRYAKRVKKGLEILTEVLGFFM